MPAGAPPRLRTGIVGDTRPTVGLVGNFTFWGRRAFPCRRAGGPPRGAVGPAAGVLARFREYPPAPRGKWPGATGRASAVDTRPGWTERAGLYPGIP